jgi:hypothetical protein
MNKLQGLLLDSITNFYFSDTKNIKALLNIINDKSTSIRLIDWFVTNYSKKNNVFIVNEDKSTNKQNIFKVYASYKGQLKSYSKKQFDPFNRSKRLDFYYSETEFITTTIGQLNFFRWAIENNILDYIQKNKELIEADMNNNIKYTYNKSNNNRKKRQSLSVCATKFLNKDDITIIVNFDK